MQVHLQNLQGHRVTVKVT